MKQNQTFKKLDIRQIEFLSWLLLENPKAWYGKYVTKLVGAAEYPDIDTKFLNGLLNKFKDEYIRKTR